MTISNRTRHGMNSIRAIREFTNRVANECYTGKRDFADATRAAAIAKVSAELLMVEMQLAATSTPDGVPAPHPLGDSGGLDLGAPGVYVEHTDSKKEGTSAKGTPVDEVKTVTRTAGEPRPLPSDF